MLERGRRDSAKVDWEKCPKGVRVPFIEVRLYGLSISDRLWGREVVEPPKLLLDRLVGRLSSPSFPVTGPNDSRLMPVVDIRETWRIVGVPLSSMIEDVLLLLTELPMVLLRLLIVTLGGM